MMMAKMMLERQRFRHIIDTLVEFNKLEQPVLLKDYSCDFCGISDVVERCGMYSNLVNCNDCGVLYTYNTPQRVNISEDHNIVKLI